MKRIYNFNAGPAMLPLEVLQEVQSELLDLQGSGMSILEMSHRAPIYEKINAEAEADIKELLGLGDDYCVLFMGGGASLQLIRTCAARAMTWRGLAQRLMMTY